MYKPPQHKVHPIPLHSSQTKEMTHGFVFVSASGCFQPSPITFVCKEAFEAVSSSYEKLFIHQVGYPQLWFNFAIDILYLDWGWVGQGLCYGNDECGVDMLEKVKHLALLHRRQDIEQFADDKTDPHQSHELHVRILLYDFPNLETLTLVNRRHYTEDAHDLTFVDNVQDLRIWEYRDWDWDQHKPPTWDSQALDLEALGSMIQEDGQKVPEIKTKIVADRKTVERLFDIAGGEEKFPILQALNHYWLYKIRWMEQPGITDVSWEQQIEYLKMIIEAWKRDGTEWGEDDHFPERMCIWTAKDLEEALVWMVNKVGEA